MGRPRNAVPTVAKNLSLPVPLVDKIDLLLWSEIEQRVPHGVWSGYVIKALEEKMANDVAARYKEAILDDKA